MVPGIGGAASSVAGGVASSVAGGVASSVATAGASILFAAAGQWVVSGAVWLMGQVGHSLFATTAVGLDTGWFRAHEATMAALAAAVAVPMVCCAAIQAVYSQSASMLLRSFLVYLPLALLLTGVAVALVQLALSATDALSSDVMSSAGVDATNLFSGLSASLGSAVLGPGVPGFVVLVAGLLVAAGSLALWLELVVRAAAVTAATLFLPLALAALVWPAVAHWCRRLADTLVALILSKLVVASVLSLGVAALTGGLGLSSDGAGGGFAAVVSAVALLVIAVVSPFTLLRLVPAVEAGAVQQLESLRHRAVSAGRDAAQTGLDVAKMLASGAGGAGEAAVGTSGGAEGAGGGAGTGAVGAGIAGVGASPGSGGGEEGGPGASRSDDDENDVTSESPDLRTTTWSEATGGASSDDESGAGAGGAAPEGGPASRRASDTATPADLRTASSSSSSSSSPSPGASPAASSSVEVDDAAPSPSTDAGRDAGRAPTRQGGASPAPERGDDPAGSAGP